MKNSLILTALGLIFPLYSHAQSDTDTLYYDRNWRGVESKAFATYYRVIPKSNDTIFSKHYRDYYMTGEMQSEGSYLTIDKYDDANSVFDGEFINYFKSGKVEQKGSRTNGKQEGEYIKYNEDGLMAIHAYFKNDKLDGLYTEFTENDICIQIEYADGEPCNDWYMLSSKNGLALKLRLSDNTPIYESPSINEIKTEYQHGEPWPYYNKNGIMVGMTNTKVKDYGKYYRIPIIISNNSLNPIDFDPSMITSVLVDKNGTEVELKVYSAEEYMKKVRTSQNWSMALTGLAEGLAAAGAGYSTSTTNSYYSGNSSTYGSASAYGSGGYATGNYSGSSYYSGSSVSSTTTYNSAAAYQAQVIANNRMAQYEDALLSERAAKDEGYFKRTTISPGETVSGYVHIERKKGVSMTVYIDINGAIYTFPWDVSE